MILVITLVIGILSYFLQPIIKKHAYIIYGLAVLLGGASIFLTKVKPLAPIRAGFIGFAIIYIVMIIGILPKKTKIFKRLYKIRPNLSIISFILLTAHALFYILNRNTIDAQLDPFGVIAYIVMIPLFITSFKDLPTKKHLFKWKKLHRFSYLAYILTFIHLLIVSEGVNFIIYLLMFIPYFIVKPYRLVKIDMPMMRKSRGNAI